MTEEVTFSSFVDDLDAFLRKTVNSVLEDKTYDKSEAQSWSKEITTQIMEGLNRQQNGFKYLVSTTIFQKGDASLNFSTSCLWEKGVDGSVTVRIENDTMLCFVCLFGLKQ